MIASRCIQSDFVQTDLQQETQSSHHWIEIFVNKTLPYICKLPSTRAITNQECRAMERVKRDVNMREEERRWEETGGEKEELQEGSWKSCDFKSFLWDERVLCAMLCARHGAPDSCMLKFLDPAAPKVSNIQFKSSRRSLPVRQSTAKITKKTTKPKSPSVLLRKQWRKQIQSSCPNSKLKYTRKRGNSKKRLLPTSDTAMELKKRYYKYNGVNKHTETGVSWWWVETEGKKLASAGV